MTDLRIADGAAVGDWIEPELSGERGSVTGTVPDRDEAFVRILHPASKGGEPVTWGEVAADLGRAVHPLAQWDAILDAPRSEAFPIGPRDPLTWDADKVNPPLPE